MYLRLFLKCQYLELFPGIFDERIDSAGGLGEVGTSKGPAGSRWFRFLFFIKLENSFTYWLTV